MRITTTGMRVNRCSIWAFCLVAIFLLGPAMIIGPTYAEEGGEIQIFSGRLGVDNAAWYTLPDLKEGQTLYVYMTRTSGNLDPFVGVFDRTYEDGELQEVYDAQLEQALAEGVEPIEAVSDITDELALAWDDDDGHGYDAALKYVVPSDGDYQLVASGALTNESFGGYRLWIGFDAPDVLKGSARSTGAAIGYLDRKASAVGVAVQEITGTLTVSEPDIYYKMEPVNAGDIFYAYVEAISGDLIPRMVLYDYGGKPLRSANLLGRDPTATLSHHFRDDSQQNILHIFNHPYAQTEPVTSGEYRLLVGLNNPDVLTGEAEPTGDEVLKEPTQVQIGIKLDQITDVDQKAENFGVVASLAMKWQDPELAFSPDDCQCSFKSFTGDAFSKFADQNDITWPEFTIFNQQGNRWTQNQYTTVLPGGEAVYAERFTTDLQAPDFDFRQFPFDTQQLAIRVTSILPEEFFLFTDAPGMTAIGTELGEEEWSVVDSHTEISLHNDERSTYSLVMHVRRHQSFYLFRILLPIVLIILVSWFTFFLKDYGKRIEVTSANLLLFIAFNFTISDELPRLGYLTFMDSILIMTFVLSAFTIIFNVFLKRAETRNNGELTRSLVVIDHLMLWLYPLLFALGAAILIRHFFIN